MEARLFCFCTASSDPESKWWTTPTQALSPEDLIQPQDRVAAWESGK
jgi:hypothetical protein